MATSASVVHDNISNPTEWTHIRGLLRAHAPPPADVHSKISALSDELRRFDTKRAELQAQLDELTSQRAAFRSHHDDCCGLLSPIRRLPSELLVEIFHLCCHFESRADKSTSASMARLANAPLLTLSRVCFRWHEIGLGTPSLWGTVELEGALWTDCTVANTATRLLRCALERGANHPLAVTVTNTVNVSHLGPSLEILAQHSERWQSVEIAAPFVDLQHLAVVKGNLPRLKRLGIGCWGSAATTSFDIFQVAPSLTSLHFTGNIVNVPVFSDLPFEQLNEMTCSEVLGELALFTTPLSRLSRTATLDLQLLPVPGSDAGLAETFHVRTVTSDVSGLDISLDAGFSSLDAQGILCKVLAGLTLPYLVRLGFEPEATERSPRLALPWPHLQYICLSQRSSFHTHLEELCLYAVAITERELLECLADLPMLKHLSISDHPSSPHGEHLLITDTLLAALTRTPSAPCLVPHLYWLDCRTMLNFDQAVYMDCVASRLYGAPPGVAFEASLCSIPGYDRDLEPETWARLDKFWEDRRMPFSFIVGK